ncbi:hypothetical protein [Actinomadura sp. DC4]|nr:hypothetical protein [Actinomadura sp. DC4]MDN3352358.1 hypothetical protein [Actinomadura sp. DC4]
MDAAEAALVAVIVPGELLGDVNGLRLTGCEVNEGRWFVRAQRILDPT